MRHLVLALVLLFQAYGCTRTITEFSVKTNIKQEDKFVVLSPQIKLNKYKKGLTSAFLGSITGQLGKRAFSHRVVWKNMGKIYDNFSSRLYLLVKEVFFEKSDSLIPVLAKKDWKETFTVNIKLFGKNFSEALEKAHIKSFTPRFIVISGIEKKDTTFTGNLVLKYYCAVVDISSLSVVWAMSFDSKSAFNEHNLVIKSHAAAKELVKELKSWIKSAK